VALTDLLDAGLAQTFNRKKGSICEAQHSEAGPCYEEGATGASEGQEMGRW